jgi:hypothetical protein
MHHKDPHSSAAPPAPCAALPAFLAILSKEWIKLRVPWLIMFVLSTGYALYLCLRVRRLFSLHDAVNIWNTWIEKNYLFFAPYLLIPLLCGLLIGGWQFLPETIQQRIRLSLHLPVGEDRMISWHVFAGLLAITTIILPACGMFLFTALWFFPTEMLTHLFWTLAPGVLAGFASYFLVVALHLEPAWRMRIVYLLMAAGALPLFFLDGFYGHYSRVLWIGFMWTALLFILPISASRRFREGEGR